MSAEEWRPVPGYEGAYEVSDQGRVRALARMSAGKHQHRVPARVLAVHAKPGTGYLAVHLTKGGASKTVNAHRLVAEAFIGPRPDGMDTCHNDGDRLNNSASNLRYDTRGANLRDSVAHGTHPWSSATECRQGHAYTPENTRICNYGSGTHRRCRTCDRQTAAVRRERKRADAIETRELRAA